ncbi:MAG: AMP-binding protein [Deltaproteobacteria bacterium]|nr:AMP-binding protein [Deltaproteobacteria bacterium]
MGVHDFTIYDMIRRNARTHADNVSVVFNDRRLTHIQFKHHCDRLAGGLANAGVGKGDRIAVVAQNSDEYLILYGAASKLGAIVLPVNWRFQSNEVKYVLEDGAPKVLFAGPEYQASAVEAAGGIDTIQGFYSIGGHGTSDRFQPFEALYSENDADRDFDVSTESGYAIIHTAAVEGRPRGALVSQGGVTAGNLMIMQRYGIGPGDAHVCLIPLFHIAGFGLAMAVMHAGGKNVIMDRFDAKTALKLIETEKSTIFFDFAPILKSLMDANDEEKRDISSIRMVVGLDQAENILRFQKWAPGASFWSLFAQAEALCVTTAPYNEKPGSAGIPYPTARVALFDDYDREAPTGAPGEICVRSANVFRGYWGLDEQTRHTFRNNWHHTGDIGRFDEDGYLWYVKRKAEKELIKTGGENVYPSEVEKAILTHDSVRETCVIGVPDKDWGEAVKAVCVLEPGAQLKPEELIEYVASKIARYKKPRYVVFTDRLPKKADGEIDRERVKKDHGGQC